MLILCKKMMTNLMIEIMELLGEELEGKKNKCPNLCKIKI